MACMKWQSFVWLMTSLTIQNLSNAVERERSLTKTPRNHQWTLWLCVPSLAQKASSRLLQVWPQELETWRICCGNWLQNEVKTSTGMGKGHFLPWVLCYCTSFAWSAICWGDRHVECGHKTPGFLRQPWMLASTGLRPHFLDSRSICSLVSLALFWVSYQMLKQIMIKVLWTAFAGDKYNGFAISLFFLLLSALNLVPRVSLSPPPRAREERPWSGLVTWLWDKWKR